MGRLYVRVSLIKKEDSDWPETLNTFLLLSLYFFCFWGICGRMYEINRTQKFTEMFGKSVAMEKGRFRWSSLLRVEWKGKERLAEAEWVLAVLSELLRPKTNWELSCSDIRNAGQMESLCPSCYDNMNRWNRLSKFLLDWPPKTNQVLTESLLGDSLSTHQCLPPSGWKMDLRVCRGLFKLSFYLLLSQQFTEFSENCLPVFI